MALTVTETVLYRAIGAKQLACTGDVTSGNKIVYSGVRCVRGILLVADATGGSTQININGSSGQIMYKGSPTVSTGTWLSLPTFPQYLADMTVELNGSNHVAGLVFIEDPSYDGTRRG